ncbi:MAG: hypothetical protein OSA99_19360, partial [Acidimicrobiales bacterium]|nr:hypothetical protein [Acidimicrobiales bacterium]
DDGEDDEDDSGERLRVRRVTGRRGLRRRAAPAHEKTVPDEPTPDQAVTEEAEPEAGEADPVSESTTGSEDTEPRVPERRPTAQFRSGAAVPARQEAPQRRAVAPSRETRAADQDADDEGASGARTPANGRRPRRTRPLRAR